MIPSEAFPILGSSEPRFVVGDDEELLMGPVFFRELEQFMRRLYTERRMGADEMRDWASLLHVRLERMDTLLNFGRSLKS